MKIEAIHLHEIQMPLAHPFETSFGVTTRRRILLVELEADGFTAWGECVAGEHPYFSDEQVDTAWQIALTELAPRLVNTEVSSGRDCPALFEQVRGHRMAKAAIENAVWDLDAQRQGIALSKLLGGKREIIPCGVSIGIQPTPEKLMELVAKEVAAEHGRTMDPRRLRLVAPMHIAATREQARADVAHGLARWCEYFDRDRKSVV